jgi:hypothetical protein
VSVSDDTLFLSIQKSVASYLEDITTSTRVYVFTIGVDDMGIQHYDYYPDVDTYADASADGTYTDAGSDVSTDTSLTHIDLTGLEVTVD